LFDLDGLRFSTQLARLIFIQNRNDSISAQTTSLASPVNAAYTISNAANHGNGGNQVNLSSASSIGLSDSEAAALVYMHEEEKLAHDVHATMYST